MDGQRQSARHKKREPLAVACCKGIESPYEHLSQTHETQVEQVCAKPMAMTMDTEFRKLIGCDDHLCFCAIAPWLAGVSGGIKSSERGRDILARCDEQQT
jgi:hypothetical protein